MSATLSVTGLTKSFGDDTVLDGVSLALEKGRCVAVLGPSGCGKTTLLRIVAGLERADAGTVEISGTVTDDPRPLVPPERRGVGLIFQDLALWPHMTVRRNLAFVLESRKVPAADRDGAISQALRDSGLPESLLDRRPDELSGGERQRAAFARALVQDPAVLLLDEPLTGLDRDLRHLLLATLRRLSKERGVTMLLVTHDQAEAFALADEVVILEEGRVVQRGAPAEVYAGPVDRFVAEFVGIASCVTAERANGSLRTAVGEWPVESAPDGPLLAVLRPDEVRLDAESPHRGAVADCYYQGGHWMHVVSVQEGAGEAHLLVRGTEPHAVGSDVGLTSPRPAFVPAARRSGT